VEEPGIEAACSIIMPETTNKAVIEVCKVLEKVEMSVFVFPLQTIALGTMIGKYAVMGRNKYLKKPLIRKFGILQRISPTNNLLCTRYSG